MIKDEEVQTKMSPFAICEGEVKVNDNYDGYTSMAVVLNRIDRGHLNKIDVYILEALNKYLFLTSRQLNKILGKYGESFSDNKKLIRKLEQMLKTKLVSRMYFGSIDKKASYKVYSLDKNGKYILEAKNKIVNWKPTYFIKSVGEIKSILAANQFMLAVEEKAKMFLKSFGERQIIDKKTGKKIKSKGLIELGENNKKAQILVEAPRREEEWEKVFVERMQIYKEFYSSFEKGDSDFVFAPYLIYVCEDKLHMAEVCKLLKINNIEIPNSYFTYDLIQMEKSIKNSWFNFEYNDDKVTLKQLEIPLLEDK